jgi:diacylglycerol kinase (ATP)
MNQTTIEHKRHIAILCNPLAGAGKAVNLSNQIADALGKKEIAFTLFTDTWPAEFNNYTDVWIVGGDGTLNYFVNKYTDIKLPLALFNGGTGNDFYWLLYGKIDFIQQLELVLKASPKPIDLGKCNDKYFLNGAGIGFEGAVVKSMINKKKLPGKTSFMLTILKKIFFYKEAYYKIECDEIFIKKYLMLLSVMNGRRAGGGFQIAPESAADDGWLDVVTAHRLNVFKRLRYLPVMEKGKHLKLPFITYFRTKKIIITGSVPILAHLDGEYYSADKMEIEILPARLLFCH